MLLFSLFLAFTTAQSSPVGSTIAETLDVDLTPNHYILGRELPECLNLGRYRTTSQILWSCLATIFACTWSAIHPNLSGPRESGFQRFRRQIVTMICAIIAPELIAFWAMRQLMAARIIKNEFNKKFNGEVDPELSIITKVKQWFTGPEETPRKGWTLVHGFFVQMGGFVLYDDGEPQKVLTFERMLESIRKGEIDVVSILPIQEEDIADKGKSDFLQKSLVVVQTTWFVAQCTARWRLGLPLAELEVLTLAFAALNGIIYFIWWSKPQGVQVPIKLPLKRTRDQRTPPDTTCGTFDPKLTQSTPNLTINSGESTAEATAEAETMLAHRPSEEVTAYRVDCDEELYDKESCHKFLEWWNELRGAFQSIRARQNIGSSCRVIIILFLFLIPFLAFIWVSRLTGLVENIIFYPRDREDARAIVSRFRVPMFYAEDRDPTPTTVLPAIVIGSIFGAFHLTLWSSSSFPTPLEHQWWRWCAFFITVQPALGFILFLTAYFAFLKCIQNLIYLSFSTLSSLPEDAHSSVQWADLFPHIH